MIYIKHEIIYIYIYISIMKVTFKKRHDYMIYHNSLDNDINIR